MSKTETVPAATRTPGRPRSPEAHRAILEAAIDLFVEEGFEGMSIEGVAARAGVGKTTIYRRWDSKEELVVDAIDQLVFDVEPPDTGSVREDLVEMLVKIQTIFTSSGAGEIFPRIAPHLASQSSLGRAYLERVIAPRFAHLQGMIARGVERGELPAGVDAELVRSLLVGPVMLWKLTGRLSRRGIRQRSERVVDTVLPGLRAALHDRRAGSAVAAGPADPGIQRRTGRPRPPRRHRRRGPVVGKQQE